MSKIFSIRVPEKVKPGEDVKADHTNGIRRALIELIRWCAQNEIKTSADIGNKRRAGGGTTLFIKGRRGSSAEKTIACPFGEVITYTAGEGEEAVQKTGIRGGLVYCGNKNFNTPPKELDLETSGTWLIYLEVECEANRDDDHEIILPGIKTSSITDPSEFWKSVSWSAGSGETEETQYPDNDEPEVTDGIGKIMVPIGKLTIDGGKATLVKVACGNVTITQCGGVLSHTRG